MQQLFDSASGFSGDAHCSVIYVVNPFARQVTHTAKLIDCLSLVLAQQAATVAGTCSTDAANSIVDCYRANIIFQFVPLEHILQRLHLLPSLKELAFSVFNKCRRVSMEPFFPSFLRSHRSSNGGNSCSGSNSDETEASEVTHFFFSLLL